MLEAFSVKALKNKLNDDNKKSQQQISKMKKNYEDLQKEIDALNNKLGKVKGEAAELVDKLDTDDKEKDNEIKARITDKLADCDRDINGDKAADKRPVTDSKDKEPTLQARKKDIIAAINKMVNQFNDNNKQIKDNNKAPKTEKDMTDLIAKNKEIQDDCGKIDDKVNDGKVFAVQISDRLDNILDPTIPEVEAKFVEKNALIDDCDELFDKCEDKLKGTEAKLADLLAKTDDTIAMLEDAGPVAKPSMGGSDNEDFVKAIGDQLDKAHKTRDDLEKAQEKLGDIKAKLGEDIQPLNELGDREVTTPELEKILDSLKNVDSGLNDLNDDLLPLAKQVDKEAADAAALLEGEKDRLIQDADKMLQGLDQQLDDLDKVKKEAEKKLAEYQDMIEAAKANEGQDDPALRDALKQLQKEAAKIGDDLKEIADREKDIKKKRDEAKKAIDAFYANPDKATNEDIEAVLESINDQKEKVDALNDRADKHEEDIEQKIKDLADMLAKNNEKKGLEADMKNVQEALKEQQAAFKDIFSKLPDQIEAMQKTLGEMAKDMGPDDTADYWEERKDIDKWTDAAKKAHKDLAKYEEEFKVKDDQTKDLLSASKKTGGDIAASKKILDDLIKNQKFFNNLLEKCYDVNDVVQDT